MDGLKEIWVGVENVQLNTTFIQGLSGKAEST